MSNHDDLEIEQMRAAITQMMAQTIRASKPARWYEIVLAISGTLAVIACVKYFL